MSDKELMDELQAQLEDAKEDTTMIIMIDDMFHPRSRRYKVEEVRYNAYENRIEIVGYAE